MYRYIHSCLPALLTNEDKTTILDHTYMYLNPVKCEDGI